MRESAFSFPRVRFMAFQSLQNPPSLQFGISNFSYPRVCCSYVRDVSAPAIKFLLTIPLPRKGHVAMESPKMPFGDLWRTLRCFNVVFGGPAKR